MLKDKVNSVINLAQMIFFVAGHVLTVDAGQFLFLSD